jgi:hypothetical protein
MQKKDLNQSSKYLVKDFVGIEKIVSKYLDD